MDGSPAVRANNVRDVLQQLDDYRPGLKHTVRALIPRESLEFIEGSLRLAWIPIEHDHHVPQSIISVLGEKKAIVFFRGVLGRQVSTPMFRTLLEGGTRLFGLDPGTLVWGLEKAWHLAYRDFCRPRMLHRDSRSAFLVLDDIHPEVLAYDAYLLSIRSFLLGFFDVCRCEGELEWTFDRNQRKAEAGFSW